MVIKMRPKVIIPTGLGINSHAELGQAFENAGASVDYRHFNDLIKNPSILDEYKGMGLPGGFTMRDDLGAGQCIRNRVYGSGLRQKLHEKFEDLSFPIYDVCNSEQYTCKLDLFPSPVGTVKNDSGKHETLSWDMTVNESNDSVWLKYLKNYNLPIFAPISHGEGRVVVPPDSLKEVQDRNLIALKYAKGHICNYFALSRNGRYNPNGSSADIAGFGWKNNLMLFPHFERLLRNYQRDDKSAVKAGDVQVKFYDSTPDGLYEPTYVLFKAAVELMEGN
jgi:phosphoribosylformylglycinamidine synthase